jgi:hypothetical protein
MADPSQPSWTQDVRGIVRELVEAVVDSSKTIAGATGRFAAESLQVVDSARTRAEHSAELSAEMARKAEQAAAAAVAASTGLQAAVEEARELVRNEARIAVEQVAGQTAYLDNLGTRMKQDLEQRIEEMVARLEAGAAGQAQAAEAARESTAASQAATARIGDALTAVESAVAGARQAAQEARGAAEQAQATAVAANQALAGAREAAEASYRSASAAEEAGRRPDLAVETGLLLNRLETDYTLLTRLVQDLNVRIGNLSVAVPAGSKEAPAPPPGDAEGPPAASHAQPGVESVAGSPSSQSEYKPATPEARPVTEDEERLTPAQPSDDWAAEAPAKDDVRSFDSSGEVVEEPLQIDAPAAYEAAPANDQPAADTSTTVFGRVQVMISPVADFDRLLSLDGALARVSGVKSVTLADYTREEVAFRLDLERPLTAGAFAGQLAESAGLAIDVADASESTLSLRIA